MPDPKRTRKTPEPAPARKPRSPVSSFYWHPGDVHALERLRELLDLKRDTQVARLALRYLHRVVEGCETREAAEALIGETLAEVRAYKPGPPPGTPSPKRGRKMTAQAAA